MADTRFFTVKRRIGAKVQGRLQTLYEHLRARPPQDSPNFPVPWWAKGGKISRGENYHGLPYLVLDYPRHFARPDVAAVRTLFWWGHGYSQTLHLQGAPLDHLRAPLLRHLGTIRASNCWVGVHPSPWEHHYGPDNYRPAAHFTTAALDEHLRTHPFVKLHARLPLPESDGVVAFGEATFECFRSWLI